MAVEDLDASWKGCVCEEAMESRRLVVEASVLWRVRGTVGLTIAEDVDLRALAIVLVFHRRRRTELGQHVVYPTAPQAKQRGVSIPLVWTAVR